MKLQEALNTGYVIVAGRERRSAVLSSLFFDWHIHRWSEQGPVYSALEGKLQFFPHRWKKEFKQTEDLSAWVNCTFHGASRNHLHDLLQSDAWE